MKRVISLVCVFCMLLSLASFNVYASGKLTLTFGDSAGNSVINIDPSSEAAQVTFYITFKNASQETPMRSMGFVTNVSLDEYLVSDNEGNFVTSYTGQEWMGDSEYGTLIYLPNNDNYGDENGNVTIGTMTVTLKAGVATAGADIDLGFKFDNEGDEYVGIEGPNSTDLSVDAELVFATIHVREPQTATASATASIATSPTPPEGGYPLGAEVTYTVTVTNGDVALANAVVTDPITNQPFSDGSGIAFAAEEEKTFTGTFTVTEETLLAGDITVGANEISVTEGGSAITVTNPEATIDIAAPNGAFTVDIDNLSDPANGEFYTNGETFSYDLIITNTGNLTLSDLDIRDPMTGEPLDDTAKAALEAEIAKLVAAAKAAGDDDRADGTLAPDESVTITVSHKITPEETEAGGITPTVEGSTGKAEDPNPDSDDKQTVPATPGDNLKQLIADAEASEDPNDKPVVADEVDAKLTITVAVDEENSERKSDTAWYDGDKLTYTVTIENLGNIALQDIVVKDPFNDGNIDLSEKLADAKLAKGSDPVTFELQYEITEADVEAGKLTPADVQANSSAATVTKDDVTITVVPADLSTLLNGEDGEAGTEDDIKPTKADRTLKITVDIPAEGQPESKHDGFLTTGDKIKYTVTIENDGDVDLTDIVVIDPFHDDEDGNPVRLDLSEYLTDGKLPADGEPIAIELTYEITEDDAKNGELDVNDVEAGSSAKSTDGKDADIVVAPEDIETLIKGDDKDNPDDDPITIREEKTSAKVDVKVEDPKTDPDEYDYGDEIKYTIEVTNDGDVPLEDVVVVDPITGEKIELGTIQPGDTVIWPTNEDDRPAVHTVDEDDIEGEEGAADNDIDLSKPATVLLGTGEDAKELEDVTTDVDTKLPIADPERALKIDLENLRPEYNAKNPADAEEDNAYKNGTTIAYDVKVTNDGNVPLEGIVVKDPVTGEPIVLSELDDITVYNADGAEAAPQPENPGTLKPGQYVVIPREYTIDDDDIMNDGIDLTFEAVEPELDKDDDGNPKVTTDTTEPKIPVEPKTAGFTIDLKTVTPYNAKSSEEAEDDDCYAKGTEVEYNVIVWNTGSVTLENVTVIDPVTGKDLKLSLKGTDGDNAKYTDDGIAKLELADGEYKDDGTTYADNVLVFTCSYTVDSQAVADGGVEPEDLTPGGGAKGPKEDPDDEDENPLDDGQPKLAEPTTFTIPVVPEDARYTIDIVSEGEEGKTYGVGETFNYKIIVTNTGNVTLQNIEVIDPLTGVTVVSREGEEPTVPAGTTVTEGKIDRLCSADEGETGVNVVIFYCSHTVTTADIEDGLPKDTPITPVPGQGEDPNGEEVKPDPGETIDEVNEPELPIRKRKPGDVNVDTYVNVVDVRLDKRLALGRKPAQLVTEAENKGETLTVVYQNGVVAVEGRWTTATKVMPADATALKRYVLKRFNYPIY